MVPKTERIAKLKHEIINLKLVIYEKEEELRRLQEETEPPKNEVQQSCRVLKRDIIRYSRQMIIPQIGTHGQLKLKQSSVLIVGAGGLGCPASLYLAGAGIGRLGLVDYDVVEENNLHRQILYNEDQLGNPKVASAAFALKKINKCLEVQQYFTQLSSCNALEIVRHYDVVVDASDNVATRYLVNDACVLTNRPLVSGSALQLEGQLTVYNCAGGPCYRCLYPVPPPPETVTNCSDAGVLGTVPGVIGTLQALEVLKILLGMKDVLSSKLLLFDGESTTFRTINLRGKNDNCLVCGTNPSITQLIDYEEFCGAAANDKDWHLSLLRDDERISPEQLHTLLKSASPCVVIDVRQETEYQMCSIPNSVNIPLHSLVKNIDHLHALIPQKAESDPSPVLVCMVCRRGNDSQLAVRSLQPLLTHAYIELRDLRGGLHNWANMVDPQFPVY